MEKSLVKKVIYTLSGRGLAPLWFLLALFFARSVIQILDSIRRRRRYRHQEHRGRYHEQPGHHHEQAETGQRVWLCGLGLLACFLSIFCRWMTEWIFQPAGKMPLLGITLMRILPCMVFLIVGMLLRMSLAQVKKRKIWILLASLFVFFAVILSCKMDVNLHLMRFSSLPLAYVTGITGSLGILMFCLLLPQEGKAQKVFLPLQCLGRASLNIMALHYMDLPIYQILHSLMPEKAGGWGHLVFTLVLLGVCYGLHRILKKEH